MMKRNASNVRRRSIVALILWQTVFLLARAEETPSLVVPQASDSNTNAGFANAVDALGMMIQVVGNLEATVKSKELASIHSEDVVLTESLAAILEQADRMEPARREEFRADKICRRRPFARSLKLLMESRHTFQRRP
jgi:Flp pilus assembly protein TadD